MKHRYLYVNPRGFRNEFHIYRVPQDKVEAAERFMHVVTHQPYHNDNYHEIRWITRKEAESLLSRERQAQRENDRAGLNRHTNPVGATAMTEWEEWANEL